MENRYIGKMEFLANTFSFLFNVAKLWLGIEYLLNFFFFFFGKLEFGFQDPLVVCVTYQLNEFLIEK